MGVGVQEPESVASVHCCGGYVVVWTNGLAMGSKRGVDIWDGCRDWAPLWCCAISDQTESLREKSSVVWSKDDLRWPLRDVMSCVFESRILSSSTLISSSGEKMGLESRAGDC
ncbi:hypothetical protein CIRG_06631 [Coccidioides immitis RMSCC 2394]|uniref:Uncharacterized protein n=1 Tax=Coccidioides immitis RMSCC 2394 TaxID=404692 RepID=A0A0J6YH48_COCIT|nr:hypothetical protein CIRG_06631 [Coccidioides immitis RMSCC 2394]